MPSLFFALLLLFALALAAAVAFVGLRFRRRLRWALRFALLLGERNDGGLACDCQQVRHEHVGHGFQRSLRSCDHDTVGTAVIDKSMHGLCRNDDQAGGHGLEPRAIEEDIAAAFGDVEDLDEGVVLVRTDVPVVDAGALGNPLEVEQVVPVGRGLVAVEGVVGDFLVRHGAPRSNARIV